MNKDEQIEDLQKRLSIANKMSETNYQNYCEALKTINQFRKMFTEDNTKLENIDFSYQIKTAKDEEIEALKDRVHELEMRLEVFEKGLERATKFINSI